MAHNNNIIYFLIIQNIPAQSTTSISIEYRSKLYALFMQQSKIWRTLVACLNYALKLSLLQTPCVYTTFQTAKQFIAN